MTVRRRRNGKASSSTGCTAVLTAMVFAGSSAECSLFARRDSAAAAEQIAEQNARQRFCRACFVRLVARHKLQQPVRQITKQKVSQIATIFAKLMHDWTLGALQLFMNLQSSRPGECQAVRQACMILP